MTLCQTAVSWPNGRSTREVSRKIEVDTKELAAFINRHWPGLNDMTKWLSMSIEENKKISLAIMQSFGIDFNEDGGGP